MQLPPGNRAAKHLVIGGCGGGYPLGDGRWRLHRDDFDVQAGPAQVITQFLKPVPVAMGGNLPALPRKKHLTGPVFRNLEGRSRRHQGPLLIGPVQ